MPPLSQSFLHICHQFRLLSSFFILDTRFYQIDFFVGFGRQQRDQEHEKVHRIEADAGTGQVVDEGPVADDQKDAAVPEGALQVLDAHAPGRGLHEGLPGLRRQTMQS